MASGETRTRVDEAWSDFVAAAKSVTETAKRAQKNHSVNNHPVEHLDTAAAGHLLQLLRSELDVKRSMFQMEWTKYIQELNEEANKRSAEAERRGEASERRHREEMAELQKQSVVRQHEANVIQARMLWATVSMVMFTVVATICAGLQAFAALRTH